MAVAEIRNATQAELRKACSDCGHSLSFHGKRTGVACRAMGCRGGQGSERCQGFVEVVHSATKLIFLPPTSKSA